LGDHHRPTNIHKKPLYSTLAHYPGRVAPVNTADHQNERAPIKNENFFGLENSAKQAKKKDLFDEKQRRGSKC
jgi:hypothetical protein